MEKFNKSKKRSAIESPALSNASSPVDNAIIPASSIIIIESDPSPELSSNPVDNSASDCQQPELSLSLSPVVESPSDYHPPAKKFKMMMKNKIPQNTKKIVQFVFFCLIKLNK